MPLRSPAAVLAAVLLPAFAAFISAGPARSADFTDAAGRRVVLPAQISRILPAEPNAEVLVFVLAPDKLVGLSRLPGRGALLPRASRLPVLGWRPRSVPASMAETARQLHPDLIIDAGAVTPDRAAFADQVMQLTGIPYILVDDSFPRMPTVLRSTGAMVGDNDRAIDLALFAEHAIAGLRGRLLIRPANARPHVYYGRGPDGLTAALPGSPAGEAIDEAGAINVAAPLGRGAEVAISRAQLLGRAAAQPGLAAALGGAQQAGLSRTRQPVRLDRGPVRGQPADRALLAVDAVLSRCDPGRPARDDLRLLRQVLRTQADQRATRGNGPAGRGPAAQRAAPGRRTAGRARSRSGVDIAVRHARCTEHNAYCAGRAECAIRRLKRDACPTKHSPGKQRGRHLRRPDRTVALPIANGGHSGDRSSRRVTADGPPRPPDRAVNPGAWQGRAYQYQTRP